MWGFTGIKGGVSSDISLFVEAQVCPVLHGSISVGLGGISATVGVNNATHSIDVNATAGWDSILLALVIFAGACSVVLA